MSKKYFIGIDVGATKIHGGVVDEYGKIIYRYHTFTPKEGGIYIMDALISTISELLNYSTNIVSIGIGSPGKVNPKTGSLEGCTPNMLNWHKQPLKQTIEQSFSLPVYVDNDANAAALGEYYCGGARSYKNIVLLTLGTGVGSGIIIENQILHGTRGKGGELGHMIIAAQGRKCNCGQTGCLEAYASGTAITKTAKAFIYDPVYADSYLQKYADELDGTHIFEGAMKKDKLCIRILDELYFYLSIGIINIMNIFAPELILIGGGISRQKEFLLNGLKMSLSKICSNKDILAPQFIQLATLKEDAGIIGAAFLGKNDFT